MTIAPRLAYTLAAVTLLAAAPPPHTRVPAQALTADSIIARYYRAVGGYEKIKSVVSRKMTGLYSEGSMEASTEILWRRPELPLVNIHGTWFEYSEGFDGATWAYDVVTKKLMRDKNPTSDAARRSAEFDESIVDYASKGYTVALTGTVRISEINTYRLRVRLTDGWEKDYLIDTASFLIVAVRQAQPGREVASKLGSYSMYEDWRRVGGLRVPYRFVEKDGATGKPINTLQWKTITHNVAIPETAIRPPGQR